MTLQQQQQEDSLFEIKVPIFYEWIIDKDLPVECDEESSLYNHVYELAFYFGARVLTAPACSLPGFSGVKYYLNIDLNAKSNNTVLDFCVAVNYKKYTIDADFTFAINDCEPKHFKHTLYGETENEDEHSAITVYRCLPECKRCAFCINQKVVFRIEGIFTVKRIADLPFLIEVSNEVKELRDETTDTKDFVIVTKEQEIQVHKFVLIENSIVFAIMFDCDNWKETMENRIVIPEFSYEIVKYAIDACYGETSLNQLTTKEALLMFFQIADKYDMEKIIEAIKGNIAFTPHNVIEYANFFFRNNAEELVNCCIDYILSCSQYSISIKDIEMLNSQIRGMFFDRVLVSPVLKKDLKREHQIFYRPDPKRYQDEKELDEDEAMA